MASQKEKKIYTKNSTKFKSEISKKRKMPKKEPEDSLRQRLTQVSQFLKENKKTKITLARILRISSLSGRKTKSKTYSLPMIKKRRVLPYQ
jgi:hypothetical protein